MNMSRNFYYSNDNYNEHKVVHKTNAWNRYLINLTKLFGLKENQTILIKRLMKA